MRIEFKICIVDMQIFLLEKKLFKEKRMIVEWRSEDEVKKRKWIYY